MPHTSVRRKLGSVLTLHGSLNGRLRGRLAASPLRTASSHATVPVPTSDISRGKYLGECFSAALAKYCFIGEYYHQFLPAEPYNCPCGQPTQTRAHILQDCPRDAPHRHVLRAASRTIDLPTVLGTKDGITALATFIARSGAFTKTSATRPVPAEGETEAQDAEDTADDDPGDEAGAVGEVEHSDDEDCGA